MDSSLSNSNFVQMYQKISEAKAQDVSYCGKSHQNLLTKISSVFLGMWAVSHLWSCILQYLSLTTARCLQKCLCTLHVTIVAAAPNTNLRPKQYVAKGNPEDGITFLRIELKMHAKTVIQTTGLIENENHVKKVHQWKTPGKEWQCHIYYHNNTTIWATRYHNRNILMSLLVKQFLDDTQHTQSLKIDTSL